MASIYLGRITKVGQKLPIAPDGVINLNCLNFFPNNIMHGIHLYEISPYILSDQGIIFENHYQYCKLYRKVYAQREVKSGKLIWEHPEEIHINEEGKVTSEYWTWRTKGFNNPYPVRYPNGFHGRTECVASLYYNGSGWEFLSYVEARKKIYCKTYERLVKRTNAYKQLKNLYDSGISLQINEIDVRPLLLTEDVLHREINNTTQPFRFSNMSDGLHSSFR